MTWIDRRAAPLGSGEKTSSWRSVRLPVAVAILLTLGLVLKMEITEAAFHGAEVSPVRLARAKHSPNAGAKSFNG